MRMNDNVFVDYEDNDDNATFYMDDITNKSHNQISIANSQTNTYF